LKANQITAIATSIIAIIIVIFSGLYFLDFLLTQRQLKLNKKKAECGKTLKLQNLAFKYGKGIEYIKLLDACSKKGIYGFDEKEVLGDLYKAKLFNNKNPVPNKYVDPNPDNFCRDTYGRGWVSGKLRGSCVMEDLK
tara:strand:- start:110 stop:520 length:411 start_codon:yes stop_codon:yes gene_type:complete